MIVCFLFAYLKDNGVAYNLLACCFCLIVTLITYRYRIGNALLNWCGKYSFYIYIYMRIPMIILTEFKVKNIWLFSSFSFIFTMILAWSMSFLQVRIDNCFIKMKSID